MLEELRKTDEELDTVLRFTGLTEADLDRLKKVGPLVTPKLPALNDVFYDLLLKDPKMASFMTEKVDVAGLKEKVLKWLTNLFTGVVDEEFVQYQEKIGHTHGKFRIAPVAVAPAMTLLRLEIPKLLSEQELDGIGETHEDVEASVVRLLDLTHFLMDRSYHDRLIEVTGISKSLVERLMAS